MLTSFRVSESLRKTEIDHVNVGWFLVSNQEVVGLNISMQIVAALDMLDSFKLRKLGIVAILHTGWQS